MALTKLQTALAALTLFGTTSLAPAALADQNEAVAVAIWFVEADGTSKPYYFHDLNNPLPRWSCEARLDYLTKMHFRNSRSNPDLKNKQATRSACVPVRNIK